jgi:hypothetical protein
MTKAMNYGKDGEMYHVDGNDKCHELGQMIFVEEVVARIAVDVLSALDGSPGDKLKAVVAYRAHEVVVEEVH